MIKSMTTKCALIVAGIASMANPGAGFAEPDTNVQSYRLANGLQVILAPSTSAQNVVLVTQYRVGSADEQPGRSGFAHLFEHLMFEGTKAVPDFDKVISSVGAESNAFTQEDNTIYFMTGPKESLPVFLRLDADRMANLANAVTQEDLQNQRQIVLNEMRQNVLDRPGGAAHVQSEAALYPSGHPYAHSTIGSIADLNGATLDDVANFHRRYYVPSNAVVTLTGNFNIDEAKSLIGKTFGIIPEFASPDEPLAKPFAASHSRLQFEDALPEAAVTFRWPGPAGFSRQTVIHDMAARALSVGEGSIDNRLVVQKGIASSAYANWSDRDFGGVFSIEARAVKGVEPEKLEQAAREAFADIVKTGISADVLKVVLAELDSGYASVPTDPVSYAFQLSSMSAYGDPKDWRSGLDVARTVTTEEINAVLRSFATDKAQVTTIAPGARSADYPPVIAMATGTARSMPVAPTAEVVMPDLAAGLGNEIRLPEIAEHKLANGAKLFTYAVDDPANIAISVSLGGGSAETKPGLSRLAMSVSNRGAAALPLAELDARMRKDSISVWGASDTYSSQLVAHAPVRNFEAMANQMAEMILAPRFDSKEWKAAVSQLASAIKAAESQPPYQAGRLLTGQIYPADSPEVREPEIDKILALELKEAEALFKGRLTPENATFHVASSLPAETVADTLNRAFASWKAAGAERRFANHTKPVIRDGRQFAQVDGATQTTIMAAMAAPDVGTREAVAFDLAVQVLGGNANSRLNSVLREEKGWSYGISAGSTGIKGQKNAVLYVSTQVQTDHTEESLTEIRRIIKDFANSPVTGDELEGARRNIKSSFATSFANASSAAATALYIDQQGYAPAEIGAFLTVLDSISLNEVNVQARLIAESPMAVAVAGDKKAIK